ncbi:MAG: serine protease [Anaerolineaceae bacterium]
MKRKNPISRLLVVLLALSLVAMACTTTTPTPVSNSKLEVRAQLPTVDIPIGSEFTMTLQLKNVGTNDAVIEEIRLPASLMGITTFAGSVPALVLTSTATNEGVIKVGMTVPKDSTGEVKLSFKAEAAGALDGIGQVTSEVGGYQFTVQGDVVGVNPSGWEPGLSVSSEPPGLGPIPYQAVVQIKAVVRIDGELQIGWTGSGSLISADGLTLTNAHVVLSDRFYTVEDLIISLTLQDDSPPIDTYYASIVQVDEALDLALIKPRTDMQGNPIEYNTMNLPFVGLGDSESLSLGDSITILGYPGIGGETITLTRGEVSGFTAEEGYGNRAYIKTNATIAGGNSGGLAVNEKGELIGVPTQVGSGDINTNIVDCRALADTNRDGHVDDNDTCVPTGGFINAIRPVALALPIIEAARLGQVNITSGSIAEEPVADNKGTVVFEDNFEDPESGWASQSSAEGSVGYEDGYYAIHINKTSYMYWSTLDYNYPSVYMRVDAQVFTSVGDGDFGLMCGIQDDDNFTVLDVSEDGYYSIWKYVDNEYVSLVEWTKSDLLLQGGVLTIEGACSAEGLVLGVNGYKLAEYVDPDFTPGTIGLIAGTYDTPNLAVGFDNFTLMIP